MSPAGTRTATSIISTGLVAAQEHSPRAAHVAMLGVLVAVALVSYGLIRWRRRRARSERESEPK